MWNNAIRLNWMTSRGMSRANSFFNCYIQLGIQISLFSRSVSKTMAALFVSICQRSSSEEKKKRSKRKRARVAWSRASPSPSASHSKSATRAHVLFIHFCVAPACFLILICEEAILFSLSNPHPSLKHKGPLISVKWRLVNMHTGRVNHNCVRLTAAWFHWQL